MRPSLYTRKWQEVGDVQRPHNTFVRTEPATSNFDVRVRRGLFLYFPIAEQRRSCSYRPRKYVSGERVYIPLAHCTHTKPKTHTEQHRSRRRKGTCLVFEQFSAHASYVKVLFCRALGANNASCGSRATQNKKPKKIKHRVKLLFFRSRRDLQNTKCLKRSKEFLPNGR